MAKMSWETEYIESYFMNDSDAYEGALKLVKATKRATGLRAHIRSNMKAMVTTAKYIEGSEFDKRKFQPRVLELSLYHYFTQESAHG